MALEANSDKLVVMAKEEERLDISETEEEEICALSSVMEVLTVEGGEGIINGGEYGWGWNSSDWNFLSLYSPCLLP